MYTHVDLALLHSKVLATDVVDIGLYEQMLADHVLR